MSKKCSKELLAFKSKILAMTEGPFGLWLCEDTMNWLKSTTVSPRDEEIRSELEATIKRQDQIAADGNATEEEEEEEEEEEDAD